MSLVACLNFKTSRVGALSMFHVAVGNLKKECCLSRFQFKWCRHFLGHVACRNLPWQSLNRRVQALGCIKGNQGNLAGICMEILEQNVL